MAPRELLLKFPSPTIDLLRTRARSKDVYTSRVLAAVVAVVLARRVVVANALNVRMDPADEGVHLAEFGVLSDLRARRALGRRLERKATGGGKNYPAAPPWPLRDSAGASAANIRACNPWPGPSVGT